MKRSVLFLFLAVVCSSTATVHAQSLRPEAGLTIVNAGRRGSRLARRGERDSRRVLGADGTLGRIRPA